jgi:hypothetical protein
MSTTTSPVTLPLTQQVVGFLDALYGGNARGYARAVVGRGSAATSRVMPAGRVAFVPPWILSELEYAVPDDICLSAATTDQGGHRLLNFCACWVEIDLKPIFDNREGWIASDAALAAARERLDAFMPASLVIDQAWSWLCLWLLDRPLALDVADGLQRAERVQRALAVALGGLADEARVVIPKGSHSQGGAQYATLPAWSPARPACRLPGSVNHDHGDGEVVTLAALHPDRRYTIDTIEAAAGQEETQ